MRGLNHLRGWQYSDAVFQWPGKRPIWRSDEARGRTPAEFLLAYCNVQQKQHRCAFEQSHSVVVTDTRMWIVLIEN
jgi:hypothetical protein